MEDITLNALQTFQKNLAYLEKNHKTVYDKTNLLNLLIEEGEYKERYALEYKEESYFDIQELSSGEWLYGENSLEYSQRIVDNTDFKRTGGVFKGHRFVYATDVQAEEIDKSELSFHNALWATIKIINYTNKYTTQETYMNRVQKVIFLDIGLGLHIEEIIQKLDPQVIFIEESNLETFRLSLFVVDYTAIANNRFLYFSIANDEERERENFVSFLDKGNNYNLTMKHIPFNKGYESLLRRLQGHVLSQSYINYGYSAMLLRFIDSPHYLVNGYTFLNVNKFHTDNILSNTPVLLLFSGPSTLKNIEWIQANRSRFIVVSALSTCRLLNKYNITPDVVVHIDPGAANTAVLFEDLDSDKYFKNTVVLLASNVDETTTQRFNQSKIYFIEQGTLYKKGFGRLSAPSVGEYTYGLFLIFGAKNLFLLGIDLALDNETFQSHGGLHPFQTKGEIDETSAVLDPTVSVEYIKGNLLEKVPSNAGYKMSHAQFEVFSDSLKKQDTLVYNLSNGAYLKGAEPLHLADFDWNQYPPLENQKIHDEIILFLNDISSNEFNSDDKSTMIHQVTEAKKLEKIIKQFQKKKFAHIQAYLDALGQLSWDLSDMDYRRNSDLAQVYYEYFQIILSYIFDMFNTKDLKSPNKHLTQINAILIQQLFKISKLYISKLENYLK
jgi:hypothetical protein